MTTKTLNLSTVDIVKAARPIGPDDPTDIAAAKLDTLIKHPPETSRRITFTPELAERVLTQRNLNNRPMKPGKIKDYARDLREGRWGLTGDTIKFARDGSLRDGQNRLAAVVRAQTPLETHVVFGVDQNLFSRMDIGKNRTAADVFSIAGLHYANHAAATVRWLLIFTGSNPADRSAHFTNEELLSAYREKFDPVQVEDSVRIGLEIKKQTGAPVAPVAALHYLFKQADGDKASHFFMDWANGAGNAKAPARILQKQLAALAVATNNRVHESVRNAMIIRAYEAYRDGRSLKPSDLAWEPGDQFPLKGKAEPKPQPAGRARGKGKGQGEESRASA
jgi:hypothetical protein